MDEKLTPEQIYEKYHYLVDVTIQRMFANPDNYAKSRGLEYDDLIQFGRIGLWTGCESYCSVKFANVKLQNFLIRNIRWKVYRHLYMESVNYLRHKTKEVTDDNKVTVLSMSNNPYSNLEDETFYDIVSQDNIDSFEQRFPSPETVTISNLTAIKMFEKLDKKEQNLVELRLTGLTYQDIAERLGVSKQYISSKFKDMANKYRDYFTNVMGVRIWHLKNYLISIST